MSRTNLNGMSGKSVWWQEPMVWLIIALPITAIIGSMITLWYATDKPDPLVSEHYYKDGLGIHQHNQQAQLAQSLGLVADITVKQPGTLEIRLSGRYAEPPRSLLLLLVHPTDSAQDIHIEALGFAAGQYRTHLPSLPAGKRRLIIEPSDHVWRLAGDWELPFQGTLHLAADAPLATTPP